MQAAKDTFLRTLSERLTGLNPARTVTLDGGARAAVLAVENETPSAYAERETFVVSWESAALAVPGAGLMYAECKVSYGSQGSDAMLRTDRGRTVTAMDGELLGMCTPRWAAKHDYTQTPPAALGTNVFWTAPVLEGLSEAGGVLTRTAKVRLYFFPEVG